MTKAQAWKEAVKRWGKKAIIDFRPRALIEPDKVPLRGRHTALREEILAVEKLDQTPELRERLRALRREKQELFGLLIGDRCQVGKEMEILRAFHVMGSGDTWEEAFAKADERYPTRCT